MILDQLVYVGLIWGEVGHLCSMDLNSHFEYDLEGLFLLMNQNSSSVFNILEELSYIDDLINPKTSLAMFEVILPKTLKLLLLDELLSIAILLIIPPATLVSILWL